MPNPLPFPLWSAAYFAPMSITGEAKGMELKSNSQVDFPASEISDDDSGLKQMNAVALAERQVPLAPG